MLKVLIQIEQNHFFPNMNLAFKTFGTCLIVRDTLVVRVKSSAD